MDIIVDTESKGYDKLRIFYDGMEITPVLTCARLTIIEESLWDVFDEPKEKNAIEQIKKMIMEDLKNETGTD